MLIVAPAPDLATAASTAAEMSNAKSRRQIMGNLLMTVTDGAVSFAGCNLDGHSTVAVSAEEAEPGSAVVDGPACQIACWLAPGRAGWRTATALAGGRKRCRLAIYGDKPVNCPG
jgi:hypothetical protein